MIEKILLVDDEPDILRIGQLSLGRVGGWRVLALPSGESALQTVIDERPDVVLLDVMMPGLDGTAVLQAIKTHPDVGGTPVILMTARVQPHEVRRYLELGADGVIYKPFDPMTLPREILGLLEGA